MPVAFNLSEMCIFCKLFFNAVNLHVFQADYGCFFVYDVLYLLCSSDFSARCIFL